MYKNKKNSNITLMPKDKFKVIIPPSDILENELEYLLGGGCPNLQKCDCYNGECKGHKKI